MNLKNICRICLAKLEIEIVSISEELYTFLEKDLRLNDVPRTYPHLDLPNHICFNCYCSLVNFKQFYIKCQNAEKFFKYKIAVSTTQIGAVISSSLPQQDTNTVGDYNDNVTVYEENEEKNEIDSRNNNSCIVENVEIIGYNAEKYKENKLVDVAYLEEEIVGITSNNVPADKSSKTTQGSRLFVCGVCDKECYTKVDLRLHEAVHPGIRPFKCEVCDFAFKQRSQLNVHLTLHYGKRIKCSQCDKRFTRKSCLIRHFRVHSGERPFQCYQCGKAFQTRYQLRCHEEQEHNRNLEFRCQFCEEQFYSRFKLVKHKNKIHIRYYCKNCDKNFKMKESIHKHLKKEHNIDEITENNFIVKIG